MADPRDDDTGDEIERLTGFDDGPPTTAQHTQNHTRRSKERSDPGQGPKTRAANREKVKGSPQHNPR
ncbi:MAG TPA: hypothetical protein VFE13_10930 [Caulobacteraceae bacterium]|jgi:hypothetical protein|nr:hypothetical protein [Caulobacteraceae bacterium]